MSKNELCRACGSGKLKNVFSLGSFQLSSFCGPKDKFDQKKYPLNLLFCSKCSLVQLDGRVSPKNLYTNNYGYYSGINETMGKELKGIATSAKKLVGLKKEDYAVDIGSNDATLLKFYPKTVKRVGFDLVPKFKKYYKGKNLYFVNSVFNSKAFLTKFKNKKAKIVTAISMFYDVNDPGKFLEDIKKIMSPRGVLIIQQNYLASMIKLSAFDNIVHEHLAYYSLASLESLLGSHGLEVFDVVEREINGGSFRTYIQFSGGTFKIKKSVTNLKLTEKRLKLDQILTYKRFSQKVDRITKKLRKFIESEVQKGKKVFVYGASTRGNTLLQHSKLDYKLIQFGLDRNPVKWGTKIASTNIPIVSETSGRALKPDYMLILPWYFKKEIVKREKAYLKRGGHLIFPLPRFEVI